MRRRFNYTRRQRIPRRDVLITVDQETSPPEFEAVLDFDADPFPDEAAVAVEAYRQRYYERFDFGKVANMRAPQDCRLSGGEGLDRIYFRVKVVDVGDQAGRILGLADKVRAETDVETERQSIMEALWSDRMAREIWRVDFWERGRPVLEMNNSIDGLEEAFRHNPAIRALIIPAVLKQVLMFMAFVEGSLTRSPDAGWEADWLRFVSTFYPNEPPSPESSPADLEDWIQDAVSKFCDRYDPKRLILEGQGVG